jgi:sec-independent protein translocase protein TatB
MSHSSSVGKGNRLRTKGSNALLHPVTLGACFYAWWVFNMSGSEILFLLVAGLVVLGPERLPGVIRKGGKIYGDLRRAASGYEKEFRDTFSEPIAELKSTADQIRHGFGQVDTEPSPPMRPERASYPKPNFSEDLSAVDKPAESND